MTEGRRTSRHVLTQQHMQDLLCNTALNSQLGLLCCGGFADNAKEGLLLTSTHPIHM